MIKKNCKAVSALSILMAFSLCIPTTYTTFATETVITNTSFNVEKSLTKRVELEPSFGLPPSYPTKGQHPRVMFTEKDIPNIKANMEGSEGKNAVRKLNELLAKDTDGKLPDALTGVGSNMNYEVFAIIEAYAFDYVINGNTANGEKAVEATRNVLKTFKFNPNKSDIVREKGVTIYLSALVYDWCYPLMTDEDKELFVNNAETHAATILGMGGWPPTKAYGVNGHNNETHILRDLLSLSIASYDEYPDIYNLMGGYIANGMAPAKDWWYPSGSFHQGLGYTPLRFGCELTSQFLFQRMNGTSLYSDDMAKVPYLLFYTNRPDKRSFTEGDTNADKLGDSIPTWTRGDMTHLLYASSIWKDGYMKEEYKKYSNNYNFFSYTSFWPLLTPVQFLIINDPTVEGKAKTDLPNTRFFDSPNGLMVARTGLDTGFGDGVESNEAIAWAKIGETFAGNHAHLDSGSFQIYYKGPLAWDTGCYDAYASEHDSNYNKETIAHNSLLIYDPDEVPKAFENVPAARNSGGQQRRSSEPLSKEDLASPERHMADVLGMEYGEDKTNPEYSYISGDLAPGYSDKVSEVRRSMLFMPTENEEKPAIFVIMDKIVSSNPTFKKTFLLHSLQEPSVEGNVTTIKRDTIGYNGKLTMQTLYPQNPNIEKIGGLGKQFWITDKNYPPSKGKYHSDYDSNISSEFGWGRIEISPSEEATGDYFLNVMYVSDADNTSPVEKAQLIETEQILGARIMDKVTLFAKNKERLTEDIVFSIPDEGNVAVTVAGISEGEWKITDELGQTQSKIATKKGGIIYFTGSAGTYTLSTTGTKPEEPNISLEKVIKEARILLENENSKAEEIVREMIKLSNAMQKFEADKNNLKK